MRSKQKIIVACFVLAGTLLLLDICDYLYLPNRTPDSLEKKPSFDFKDEIEAKSFYEKGIIIRLDKKGNVIGIDITDSSQFFSGDDELTMKQACELLGISESTLRRRVKSGKIQFRKPNNKDYRFKRKDLLKIA